MERFQGHWKIPMFDHYCCLSKIEDIFKYKKRKLKILHNLKVLIFFSFSPLRLRYPSLKLALKQNSILFFSNLYPRLT